MEVTLVNALVVAGSTIIGAFLGKGVDWVVAWSKSRNENKKTDADVDIQKHKADVAIEIELQKADVAARKAEGEAITAAVDKAVAIQREIIADLRKDIEELVELLKKMEQERLDCRVENATLKEQLKQVKEKVAELEDELKPK